MFIVSRKMIYFLSTAAGISAKNFYHHISGHPDCSQKMDENEALDLDNQGRRSLHSQGLIGIDI